MRRGLDLAERHHLDQRQVHAAPVGPFHQRLDLFLVDALERDRVDLDPQPASCAASMPAAPWRDRPSG